MTALDDWQLLQLFVADESQDAFASLVARHVNFVYSCARRQTGSVDLAKDVTQTVFLELARSARRLRPSGPLGAWLHTVTRRASQRALRTERRRLQREHTAYELTEMNSLPSTWSRVAPLLDEALERLPQADRSAVLLRYFENRSFREVGEALGASEAAAQKRVGRAIEQLRTHLARRGAPVSAVALATELSAHAIELAPAGLTAAIAQGLSLSLAGGAAGATTFAAILQTIAMHSTTKMIALAAAAAGAMFLGTQWAEARAPESSGVSQTPAQLRAFQQQNQDQLRAEGARLRRDIVSIHTQLAEIEAKLHPPAPLPPSEAERRAGAVQSLQVISEARRKFVEKYGRPASSFQLLSQLGYLPATWLPPVLNGNADAFGELAMDPLAPLTVTLGGGIEVTLDPTDISVAAPQKQNAAPPSDVNALPTAALFQGRFFSAENRPVSLRELGDASLDVVKSVHEAGGYMESHVAVALYVVNNLQRSANDLLRDNGADPAATAALREQFGINLARMDSFVGAFARRSGEDAASVATSERLRALIGVLRQQNARQ